MIHRLAKGSDDDDDDDDFVSPGSATLKDTTCQVDVLNVLRHDNTKKQLGANHECLQDDKAMPKTT